MLSLEEWIIMCLHDLSGPYETYESCHYGETGGVTRFCRAAVIARRSAGGFCLGAEALMCLQRTAPEFSPESFPDPAQADFAPKFNRNVPDRVPRFCPNITKHHQYFVPKCSCLNCKKNAYLNKVNNIFFFAPFHTF